MEARKVVLFVTLEVVLKLTLERLKRGTKANSPTIILILILDKLQHRQQHLRRAGNFLLFVPCVWLDNKTLWHVASRKSLHQTPSLYQSGVYASSSWKASAREKQRVVLMAKTECRVFFPHQSSTSKGRTHLSRSPSRTLMSISSIGSSVRTFRSWSLPFPDQASFLVKIFLCSDWPPYHFQEQPCWRMPLSLCFHHHVDVGLVRPGGCSLTSPIASQLSKHQRSDPSLSVSSNHLQTDHNQGLFLSSQPSWWGAQTLMLSSSSCVSMPQTIWRLTTRKRLSSISLALIGVSPSWSWAAQHITFVQISFSNSLKSASSDHWHLDQN